MDGSPRFRAVFIGPANVGKTCIIRQLGTNSFQGEGMTLPSIGNAFTPVTIQGRDGRPVTFGLWDTPGEQTYRELMLAPLHSADCVALVCDLTDKATLTGLRPYLEKARAVTPALATFFLIGNKCDLDSERQISPEGLQKFAEKIEVTDYIEVSAKTGAGLMEFKAMLVGTASRPPSAPEQRLELRQTKKKDKGLSC
jgi:small GTP-binding protein